VGDAERATEVGHQAALHLGQPELRRRRRDDEVARQHELEPATHRVALHRSDQRLGATARDQTDEPAALGRRARAAREVGARGEHVSASGEDAAPEVGVVLQTVHRCVDARGDVGVQRVLLRHSIHARDEHPPVTTDLDSHGPPICAIAGSRSVVV
jgi:hypothetical protein